jgi:hypothetical protein
MANLTKQDIVDILQRHKRDLDGVVRHIEAIAEDAKVCLAETEKARCLVVATRDILIKEDTDDAP